MSARRIVETETQGRRFVTNGTKNLDWDEIRSYGPPPDLETYDNEMGDEILCTTAEREDCSTETGFETDSDLLGPEQWRTLEGWLRANAGLQ